MGKLFFSGVPTKMDVDKLVETFKPEAGQRISYDDIAAVINVAPKTSRFRTVTNAWRSRVFKNNGLQMVAEGGEFIVLTPSGALSKGISDFHKVGRALGRAGTRVAVINEAELDKEAGAQKRILQREIGAVAEAARKAAKEIAAPGTPSSVVRLAASS